MDPRRQFERIAFLWITVPILLGALLAVGVLLGAAAYSGGERLGSLAQLAVVVLGVCLMAGGIGVLAVSMIAARGINRLIEYLPPRTARIRRTTRQVTVITHRVSGLLVAPVFFLARIRAMGAGFADGVRDKLWERMNRDG